MSFLSRLVDERFWSHRRRSTSAAGVISAVLAILLFEYRYFVDHVWCWDLLAIGVTFVVVKLALMTWYYLTA
jgi:hypothetical protein